MQYADRSDGWVNGRYVGLKDFPDGTITQDALGSTSDDGYEHIRETERFGTITDDAIDPDFFTELTQTQNVDEGE